MALSVPSFRSVRQFLAPRWLTDGDGGLVGYSLDLLKDGFAKRLFLGLLARFPQNDPFGTPAPDDALAALGRDRRVVRGINETPESYAERLIRWLDDRKTAGNPYALMRKLSEYTGPGCKFRTVDATANWFTLNADGTRAVAFKQGNWNWDNDLSGVNWSRFWVIVYPPTSLWTAQPKNWGDAAGPSWGDETYSWGSTATGDQVKTMRAIVADWKPAGTKCVNIIIAFDPASFDPAGPLGVTGVSDGLELHWSKNVAGAQVPARLSTARYWDGT